MVFWVFYPPVEVLLVTLLITDHCFETIDLGSKLDIIFSFAHRVMSTVTMVIFW